MKQFLIILFLFTGINSLFSQQKITVVDEKGKTIPFVAIELSYSKNTKKITTQKALGANGIIEIDSTWKNVRIKLHHISYQKKQISIKSTTKTITLYIENLDLNTFVVTGQYAPSSDEKSVHKIRVIDSKRIEAQGAVNLQELMEQEMNIRISQDKVLGSSMSIQGLSGENVKILVDGVPVVGRLNGNIDLSQINLSNIDRVEIVEGPLSVSYGTNALAGTINLITKKNKDSFGANAESYYETIGQYNFNAGINIGIKKHLFSLKAGRNYFQGYSKEDTTRVKDWKPKEQHFGTFKYSSNIKNINYRLTSDYFQEKLTSRGEPRAPYYETAFDDYFYTKRSSNSLNISYQKPNWNLNILGGYNYYNRIKNKYLKDLVNIEYTLIDNPADQDTTVFDLVFSRGTYSFTKDSTQINFQVGYDISLESNKGKRIKDEIQQIGDYAIFASMEYRPNEKFVVRPGIRYSYNTRYESPIIPSLNMKYNWTKHLSTRASYGKGFRAPSLKELHFFFVDINHNIQGNSELKAEESDNFMMQLSYKRGIKRGVYNFELEGFYNNVENQINLSLLNANDQLYTYTNIGNFKSKGLKFNSGFRYKTYKTNFGLAYVGRYNIESENNPNVKKFFFTPEISAGFTYEVEKWKMSFNTFFKHTGTLYNYTTASDGSLEQYTIEQYNMLDLSVMKFFWKRKLKTTIGAKNIFDVGDISTNQIGSGGVHSGSGSSVPVSWGRTFFINLSLNL